MRYVLVGVSLVAAILVLTTAEAVAQPLPAAVAVDHDSAVSRLLDLTNTERDRMGLTRLALSPALQLAAQSYTTVLASSDCFAHTCGPVPNVVDRDAVAGYAGWWSLGENLAGGYPTPEDVIAGWMASSEHRANILSANFTDIGIGVASGSGRLRVYWAEEFGTRDQDSAN
ncbi:MAG: CAP domain-containing protein [Chloroflexi bacterium]|nr:CAP domain-containing protein [Chloroflexota bacterium]